MFECLLGVGIFSGKIHRYIYIYIISLCIIFFIVDWKGSFGGCYVRMFAWC